MEKRGQIFWAFIIMGIGLILTVALDANTICGTEEDSGFGRELLGRWAEADTANMPSVWISARAKPALGVAWRDLNTMVLSRELAETGEPGLIAGVMLHELAHFSQTPTNVFADRREQELEADLFALSTLRNGGCDVGPLLWFFAREHFWEARSEDVGEWSFFAYRTHPSYRKRLRQATQFTPKRPEREVLTADEVGIFRNICRRKRVEVWTDMFASELKLFSIPLPRGGSEQGHS